MGADISEREWQAHRRRTEAAVGAKNRELRERAGLSEQQMLVAINNDPHHDLGRPWSLARLRRFETGETSIGVGDLGPFLRAWGITSTDYWRELDPVFAAERD
jgi:hypothetical protein